MTGFYARKMYKYKVVVEIFGKSVVMTVKANSAKEAKEKGIAALIQKYAAVNVEFKDSIAGDMFDMIFGR